MCHDQNRGAVFLVDFLQDAHDVLRICGIQCPGRLIAKQDLRIFHQCPCDGASLLLSTGKLRWKFISMLPDSQLFHQFLQVKGITAEILTDLDVLIRGQVRNQIIKLKNKAQILSPIFKFLPAA